MDTITLPVCYLQKVIYKIDSDFQVSIQLESNPFQLELNSLFAMAMRHNKKRGFLFVSKILGKHLAVDPFLSLLGGAALAAGYLQQIYQMETPYLSEIMQTFAHPENAADVYEKVMSDPMLLPERTLFIGFAETATALGYSIVNCFTENCGYLHTTRELIPDLVPTFSFEEEHSHAVAHRCYCLQPELFIGNHPIVFVDDEITTGKTVLNIIRAIQQRFPRKEYAILSFLDWRSEEEKRQFRMMEQELGIKIRTFSLLSGMIAVKGKPGSDDCGLDKNKNSPDAEIKVLYLGLEMGSNQIHFSSVDSTGKVNKVPYLLATGRFGLASEQRKEVEELARKIGQKLKAIRQGSRILCLGTGEFMYLPMRIAAHLGEGVVYHATTRSPIRISTRQDYIIQNRFCFSSPEDPEIMNYLYNIPQDDYEELYIFLEREWPEENMQPLRNILTCLGIPRVYIVICSPLERIEG